MEGGMDFPDDININVFTVVSASKVLDHAIDP